MKWSEAIAGVRMLIHEKNPKFWTPDNIVTSLNLAFRYYVSQLSMSDSGWYKKNAAFAVVNGSRFTVLPADCDGHIDFISFGTENLDIMEFKEMTLGETGSTPTHFALLHKNLYLYPYPSADYETFLTYWFLPDILVKDDNEGEEINFPDLLAPAIVYDGAINAVLKDEEDITDEF